MTLYQMANSSYIKSIHKVVQLLLVLPYFPGRDFLTENIPWLLLPKTRGPLTLSTVYGFDININPKSDKGVDSEIYLYGTYELGTAHIIAAVLNKGDSFIDVGANIGFFSLMASQLVSSSGKVYSFEPFPESLELLNANIKLNNVENISVYDFALGAKSSEKRIYPEPENRGGSSFIKNKFNQVQGSELVKIKPLNDLAEIAHDTLIKAIKIDVEGWELEVLRGCSALLKSENPPVLIVEYSSFSIQESEERMELVGFIRGVGEYKIFKLRRGKGRISKLVLIQTDDQLPNHDNLFCFTEQHIRSLPKILF
ncbi:MAG: hypothetical protein COB85_04135 [Bacteroidetes bacterium]|nr:MAG: hypothetical protein COB85_04135 [Bacteroidota bacterium]